MGNGWDRSALVVVVDWETEKLANVKFEFVH
jgi:hypothetical protein